MGNRLNNPNPASALCVPAWQNRLQGNCHKLLTGIQTNVGTAANPNWKTWDDTSGWLMNGGWQSISTHNTEIPLGAGIDANIYNANNRMFGYTYRRVFSFGLATPSGASDGGAFGSQALTDWRYKDFQNTGQGNRNDVTQVACAINTFAQTDAFRISSANAYNANGLCFKNADSVQVP